jgi:hypothetical protein
MPAPDPGQGAPVLPARHGPGHSRPGLAPPLYDGLGIARAVTFYRLYGIIGIASIVPVLLLT